MHFMVFNGTSPLGDGTASSWHEEVIVSTAETGESRRSGWGCCKTWIKTYDDSTVFLPQINKFN